MIGEPLIRLLPYLGSIATAIAQLSAPSTSCPPHNLEQINMRRRIWTFRFVILALALTAPAVASAMTVVPIADDDLTLSVRVIIEGRVEKMESRLNPSRLAVVTFVTVRVDRVLKGPLEPGVIVLRQMGGRTDDHATEISGAPRFEPGQLVVLFLNTDHDGALRVAHVSLGHYRVEIDPATGRRLVVRAADVAALESVAAKSRVTDIGYEDEFLAAVESTLATRRDEADAYASRVADVPMRTIPPDYLPGPNRGDGASPAFTYLQPGFRWFEPDAGGSIPYRLNGRFAPTPTRGLDEAKSAIATWSTVSGSRFVASYAGSSSGGGLRPNGLNEIAFGDPLGEIDDPVNCSGIVATSGVTATSARSTVINGQRFVGITEADVVVNNGFDCVLSDPILLAEVLTHEFGHTLALGHSSERTTEPSAKLRDATMYFIAHNDGRRSSIRIDDSEAVRLLYPADLSSKPLSLLSGTLPDARPGIPYAVDLRAEDGLTPRVWEMVAGSLPDGVRLTQDGRIGGTTSSVGTFAFTVRLEDARGAEIDRAFALRVSNEPAPFLLRAAYKSASQKLQITGVHLSPSAQVIVNGVTVDGTAVRYSASKGRLTLRGSQAALGLVANRPNTIEVSIDGQRSNAVSF